MNEKHEEKRQPRNTRKKERKKERKIIVLVKKKYEWKTWRKKTTKKYKKERKIFVIGKKKYEWKTWRRKTSKKGNQERNQERKKTQNSFSGDSRFSLFHLGLVKWYINLYGLFKDKAKLVKNESNSIQPTTGGGVRVFIPFPPPVPSFTVAHPVSFSLLWLIEMQYLFFSCAQITSHFRRPLIQYYLYTTVGSWL